MIDLRCDRCLRPLAAHQFERCADGERGGPFVLMDSERARELHIERAKGSRSGGDAESSRPKAGV